MSAYGALLAPSPSRPAAPQVLEGHTGLVRSLTFSPVGASLASGSADNTVRLWAAATGELRQVGGGGDVGAIDPLFRNGPPFN